MRSFSTFLRWVARIFSLLFILAIIVFFVGEGVDFSAIGHREVILFLFLPVGLVSGFILAWWKEAAGGLVSALSVVLFYLVHFWFDGMWPQGIWFLVFASPAIVFLLSVLFEPRRGLPPIRFPDE